MITIGLTYASAALIGKNIGANDIPQAKAYLKLLTVFGFSIAFL
jgi:Na+-driven multidrug efflux pump